MSAKVETQIKTELEPRSSQILYRLWLGFLGLIMVVGLIAAYQVLTRGLIVTNLNDIVTWGLWIVADTSFIAFSAGAFMIASAIYVFKVKEFKPLARLSVFLGVTGYSMALMVLALDIGRPERFWHPLLYWNKSSFLWEVIISITFYFNILLIEFLPVIADLPAVKKRLPGLHRLAEKLHKLMPALAVAALFFSVLHQTSIGAMFSSLRGRPYWYRPNVAIQFIISAMVAGPAILLFSTLVLEKLYKKLILKKELVNNMVQLIYVAFGVFFFMRLFDLYDMFHQHLPQRYDAAALIFRSGSFWVGEVLLGMLLPVAILATSRLRKQRNWLIVATFCLMIGAYYYRWNVIVPGMIIPTISPDPELLIGSYSPNWVEWAVFNAAVAFGLLAFTLGSKYLSLFPREKEGKIEFVSIDEVPSDKGTSLPVSVVRPELVAAKK